MPLNYSFTGYIVADNQGKYETLQEATNALRKETEDLIGTVTDLNDENRENLKSWRELDATVREAKISIVDNLKEIVTKASEAVDSIHNVYDTLKTAADEYAENDGFISIDTYQSIIELGAEYMQYLRDENNLLVINEESINRVIAAKTEQLALENALTYVERLREAARSGSIESLNRLVYATDMATDATWGLVYAQLDVLRVTGDLDEAQYKAALHNIQAIESLSKTTIAGIGKVGDTAAEAAEKAAEKYKKELEALQEELEGMNDGMKDIIDYVMDMLKHRIEEQIDALNDMKAAYKEIISLKKESLKSSKNESDYQKSIADKVKEISKLQARISALSLDDSRSATAERSKLMEELAALQEDLSDKQADHALDAQMDALDAMQESYEKEKDAEIAVLEHSISSTQKLYDMAIDYIDAHWNTLYRELIEWNTEWGNSLNSEIASAWDSCCAAVERYGSYLKAVTALAEELKEVTRSIAYIEAGNYTYEGGKLSLGTKPESSIDGEEEKKNNIIVADRNVTEATNMQKASAILTQMYNNMNQHGGAANKYGTSASDKQRLSQENLQLGAALTQYGIDAFRSTNPDDYGTWYVREATGEVKKLFEAYANLIDWKNVKYMHTGGVVGDGSIKADEKLRVLQDGEWVLSKKMVDNLTAQMERIEVLESAIREMPNNLGNSPFTSLADDGYRDVGNSIANNAVYNVTVTAPVAVYPLQKMSDREIQDLTDRISTNTAGKILNQFAKSGKFAPNQSRFRML